MAQKSQITERKSIGLIYSYDEKWIAGSYYILNLISALNTLKEEEKPKIKVFSKTFSKESIKNVQETGYPYISFHKIRDGYYDYPFPKNTLNKIAVRIIKKPIFDDRPKNMQMVFPNPVGYYFEKISSKQKVSWIPDFQEDYLPNFFTKEEVAGRKTYQLALSQEKKAIIFSSYDAQADFKRLYPANQNTTFVLNFAVTHPEYQHLDFLQIREKHKLPNAYFFSPNQFWGHKNQIVILKAIKILKEQGFDYKVAFSGKMHDYRNPQYSEMLLNFVKENHLEENILFLGFLDRAEQLKIMQEARAVIQPSLFEGWSTVVEDAKAMNKFLVLSDLRVHQEQMQAHKESVLFFDPNLAENLAEKLLEFEQKNLFFRKNNINYLQNIQKFAQDFMGIVTEISK